MIRISAPCRARRLELFQEDLRLATATRVASKLAEQASGSAIHGRCLLD